MNYRVTLHHTFEEIVEVKADSEAEAESIAMFSATMTGRLDTSTDDRIITRIGSVHPGLTTAVHTEKAWEE